MHNSSKDKSKPKKDLLLILILLSFAGLFFTGSFLLNRKPAITVQITVDGEVAEELDITTNTSLVIQGYNGGTNTVVIENGTVYVSEASCPDKLCKDQGTITRSGEMIVCLPNRMIAKIVGGEPIN